VDAAAPGTLDEQGEGSLEPGTRPPRTREFVNDAISAGRDINRTMAARRLNPNVQRQWDAVRSELNRLAEAFELPAYGGKRHAYNTLAVPDRGFSTASVLAAKSSRKANIERGLQANYMPTKLAASATGSGSRNLAPFW